MIMHKTVKLKCCCGAEIELVDESGVYIDPRNGTLDEKGREYVIDVQADSWLDRHQQCLAKPETHHISPVTGSASTTEASKTVDSLERLLDDVYKWLTEGPLDDYGARCNLHQRIGQALSKQPINYNNE
jgi:hypothetical protein